MQKFSFDYYRQMLLAAQQQGYVVSSFERFDRANPRTVIMRHDVDYTLNGVYQLAQIEHSLGITATYMFRVHAHEYNLFAPHVCELVRFLRSSGHEVGLHYEATSVAMALGLDPIGLLKKEIAAIELLIDAPVRSASEHRDISHIVHEAQYLHDICDPNEFFEFWAMSQQYSKDMKYLSDSNGVWREGDLLAHLGKHQRIQVLIHPDWWFEKHLLLKGPYFHGRGN
jgi:hypothetical protein